MMDKTPIPSDTRYVPIPQQPYCCGPACLTMIMLRHGMKPLPQELIGYHLGLTVPTSRRNEFWNPRHADKPVVASGFGTQIQNEREFGMQKALDELAIPLRFEFIGAERLGSVDEFVSIIRAIIEADQDVLVCVNWRALIGNPDKNWGHILCVDKVDEAEVRLIDTDIGLKWRTFPAQDVYHSIMVHGAANYGGLWIFRKAA